METAKTNGYDVDDCVTSANINNNTGSYLFVQYPKSLSHCLLDSMAPRTVSVPFINVRVPNDSTAVANSAFNSSESSYPTKVVMEKQATAKFPHSSVSVSHLIMSGERRLQQIISRHNAAGVRAMRIISHIRRLETSHFQQLSHFSENLSDVTESSSDDDDYYSRTNLQVSET